MHEGRKRVDVIFTQRQPRSYRIDYLIALVSGAAFREDALRVKASKADCTKATSLALLGIDLDAKLGIIVESAPLRLHDIL